MRTPASPPSPQDNRLEASPARRHRRPRVGGRLLIGLLLGVALLLVLLYAALWTARFARSELGVFAPLAFGLAVALIAAVAGPWALVRYRRQLRAAVVRGAAWLRGALRATGLPRRV